MSAAPTVVIREATGDDLHAVVEVGLRTWPSTYAPIAGKDYVAMGLSKWWTEDATIPAIRAGRVLVAQVEGDVVGMVSFAPLDGHFMIWKLYVLPEFHGHKLGHRLLMAALARARAEGFMQARLSYLDGNEVAARFYAAHGFTDYDREHGGSGIPDSIWVRLDLDETHDDQQEKR
ncbi:GNAT family N-acetyltransferase [Yimella sp. cx-51]|uniref:GNAT family N-acetyltransferase n=1 Tax=Yimella sp. cx-51 TaxID=2770551 RepID=UPI00165E34C9|nr:GNAT family N-acetyltransferase [Yimella sp. cx-51]MBC9957140.1 GNAT family N-acetyltransferase [Yimella sp. cx-51]MBD2758451.1 GNAT family N-acetyltransferase [Yimella sp. cx-573]QTH37208.1 GNAT family N-acetyltransferase [Yimella sp. cx-51]